jgi:hypothetical protein
MNKINIIISLSLGLIASLILNFTLLFNRPDIDLIKGELERLKEKEKTLEGALQIKQIEMDSLLNIPPVKPKVIKEKIYDTIYAQYPDGTSISVDSLKYLWTKLVRE